MLSEKLKELRKGKGLLQRQVAHLLDVDTAYVSKMENNEKPISRNRLKKLAQIFDVNEQELTLLWVSDKLIDIIKYEENKMRCLEITIDRIKNSDL